jgi:hypothetical protein
MRVAQDLLGVADGERRAAATFMALVMLLEGSHGCLNFINFLEKKDVFSLIKESQKE